MNTYQKVLGAFAAIAMGVAIFIAVQPPESPRTMNQVLNLAPTQRMGEPVHEAATHGISQNAALKDELTHLLASNDDRRWLKAATMIGRLSPDQQWSFLSSPELRDQFEARAMRVQMVTACATRLSSIQSSNQSDAVAAWCADLSKAASVEDLFAEVRAIAASPDFLATQLAIAQANFGGHSAPPDPATLSDRIATSTNAQELTSAVLSGWRSGELVMPASADIYRSLGRIQKSEISAVLPAAVLCAQGAGCSTSALAVIHYCASMPGAICNKGQSLEQIMRRNLSPVEYEAAKAAASQAAAMQCG